MKWRCLILSIILLASLATGCLGTIPDTNIVTTPATIVTPTTTIPSPAPTIKITPSPTPTIKITPSTTPSVTPTPTPTITIPDNGTAEKKYDVKHRITLTNEGPGAVSKLDLRVALITSTEPYQDVLSEKLVPNNFTITTDDYGNRFAEFVFNNIAAGAQVSVDIDSSLVAYTVISQLSSCEGTEPDVYLAPEKYIESDADEIKSLAAQITGGKVDVCEKAKAIYDWVGDNINYAGYLPATMGALYCLHHKGGDCTEFSCLTIALCRAAGIPARFVEGVTYSAVSTETPKHDWTEIYLPGPGWVPVDATWGRFKTNRDKYFAGVTPDHIKITTGNPAVLGNNNIDFCFFEYHYWWNNAGADMSMDENWDIIARSKPASLLCSDAEYNTLRDVYASWGWDFNAGYEKYSQQARDNNWNSFWIGSTDDESRRLYFDRAGDRWKPRNIPQFLSPTSNGTYGFLPFLSFPTLRSRGLDEPIPLPPSLGKGRGRIFLKGLTPLWDPLRDERPQDIPEEI